MNVDWLKSTYPNYNDQVKYFTEIPEEKPKHRESEKLDSELKKRIKDLDIDLYTHQSKTIDKFIEGKNLTINTGTASGKTLAYALSIAHKFKTNEKNSVLIIYPTKALTRDQKSELKQIFESLNLEIDIGIYDGDISSSKKRKVRNNSDIILSNFTGLNLYLNSHDKWSQFFEKLDTIILDEAHYYTGLMGMNVAWIVRRIRRIAKYYNKDPQFILASATLGNPEEHSKHLTGKKHFIITEDGSEKGARTLIFWNPPLIGENQRRSTHRESSELLAHLTNHGYQTLMFAPSRKMTELDAEWTKEKLQKEYKTNQIKIKPYNAGHSKENRRKTEKKLKNAEIEGVVSTTALELGINIGTIEATILSGYPGKRINFWQQIGRAGRGTKKSLSVLVPFNSALDQYIIKNPKHLLKENIEDAVIDLKNNQVFSKHILAAAQELPIKEKDKKIFPEKIQKAAEMWKTKGALTGNLKTGYRYIKRDFPQSKINLFTVSKEYEIKIKEKNRTKTIPSVEKTRAYRDFHPEAIHLHQGQYYQVKEFREGKKPKIILEPVNTDYYTKTTSKTSISNIEKEKQKKIGKLKICKGKGEVKIHYTHYQKKRISDDQILGQNQIKLDPIKIQTQIMWIEIPKTIEKELKENAEKKIENNNWESLEKQYTHFNGAIHAAEHTLIHMLPLIMMIDEEDVGGISHPNHPEIQKSTIFIYDEIEGGVGFAHDAYERFEELARKTRKHLENCSCKSLGGCPACTFSPNCGNDNKPLNRPLAIKLLKKAETN